MVPILIDTLQTVQCVTLKVFGWLEEAFENRRRIRKSLVLTRVYRKGANGCVWGVPHVWTFVVVVHGDGCVTAFDNGRPFGPSSRHFWRMSAESKGLFFSSFLGGRKWKVCIEILFVVVDQLTSSKSSKAIVMLLMFVSCCSDTKLAAQVINDCDFIIWTHFLLPFFLFW